MIDLPYSTHVSDPVRLPWLVGSEDGRVLGCIVGEEAGIIDGFDKGWEGNTTFIIALLVASTAVKKVDLSVDKKVVYSAGNSVLTTVDSMVEKKVANLVEMKAMD